MTTDLQPFLHWTGGKRRLLPRLKQFVPGDYGNYYEPFIGGGALLFNQAPVNAVINDVNSELINCYRMVKKHPHKLIKLLEDHAKHDSKAYFNEVRAWDRNGKLELKTDLEKAARILYMIRVDFNGLYRVNKHNQFNVAYGKGHVPKSINKEAILKASRYFKDNHVEIHNKDFGKVLNNVKPGDLVYFDPPYIPIRQTANFTSYSSKGFNLKDQIRLRDTVKELTRKRVYCIVSNSNTDLTRKLYRGMAKYATNARREVNPSKSKQRLASELIITNFDRNFKFKD